MNIALNLSSAQLRNLRSGKGIRISPAMFGSGVDMIIDPMNYNNLLKKLERGKGAVMSMGNDELGENEIQGTGLFAGSGNRSGKISRRKKAGKWKDFAVETARDGIDLGRYGYEQYKEATNINMISLFSFIIFNTSFLLICCLCRFLYFSLRFCFSISLFLK